MGSKNVIVLDGKRTKNSETLPSLTGSCGTTTIFFRVIIFCYNPLICG